MAKGVYTIKDLLVAVAVVIALFLWADLTLFQGARHTALRLSCANTLRAIDTGPKVWANDQNQNSWQFPAATSTSKGGWAERLASPNGSRFLWTNFAILSNELGASTKVLICPTDERTPATNFIGKNSTDDHANGDFDNTRISYFISVQTNPLGPRSILMGDRNIGPGAVPDAHYGYSPSSAEGKDASVSGPICWSLKMHSWKNPEGLGNILLGDGSVQSPTSSALSPMFAKSIESTGTNATHVRLIFP